MVRKGLLALSLLLAGASLGYTEPMVVAQDAEKTITAKVAKDSAESDSIAVRERRSRKSAAFLRSVVVPGWGQLREGRETAGYAFLAAEALLIGGVVFSKYYGSWLEDDYRAYATQHAGVSSGSDHQYFVDIGNWMDRESYNEARLRDRQFDAMYTSPGTDWQWDSDANRQHFKDLRIKSDSYGQMSILFIGGIILNHLASGVEAGRSSRTTPTVTIQPTINPAGSAGVSMQVNILQALR